MSEISIHTLHASQGSRKESTRIGRGGKRGTTSGRGTKGQRARSGGRNKLALKGMRHIILQTPQRRGHANRPREKYACVNLGDLERAFDAGSHADPKQMIAKGLIRGFAKGVKVLGDGTLRKALTVKAHAFSASAREKIEKAGGKAEVINNEGCMPA